MTLHEAEALLERAKAEYNHSLSQSDSGLRVLISQDPSKLHAAQLLQDTYIDGIQAVDLEPRLQPPAAPEVVAEMQVPKLAAPLGVSVTPEAQAVTEGQDLATGYVRTSDGETQQLTKDDVGQVDAADLTGDKQA